MNEEQITVVSQKIVDDVRSVRNNKDDRFNELMYSHYQDYVKRFCDKRVAEDVLLYEGYEFFGGQKWKHRVTRKDAFLVPIRKTTKLRVRKRLTVYSNGSKSEEWLNNQPIESGDDGYIISYEREYEPIPREQLPVVNGMAWQRK